jgi:hypothetical protein
VQEFALNTTCYRSRVSGVRIFSRPSSNSRSRIDLLSFLSALFWCKFGTIGTTEARAPQCGPGTMPDVQTTLSRSSQRRDTGVNAPGQFLQIRGPANPDFLQADFRLVSPDSNSRDTLLSGMWISHHEKDNPREGGRVIQTILLPPVISKHWRTCG